MGVYYGGLVLDPVEMLSDERIVVYDGPTYLYTIHRMHFRGTYNPATFSWRLLGVPGDVAALNIPGMVAPTSDVATRLFLSQPRLQFAYWIGTDPAGHPIFDLISPTAFPSSDGNGSPVPFLTDAKNGPIPLSCHVVEVRGTKTFIVDWAIETYVNECFLFQDSQSLAALLSHRWVVEEDLDQDFFATRTIKGHAIFRSDRLMALGATPDDYRSWLFHPVQDNFKRDVQQVILSEDNTQLDYVLIDREQAFNLAPSVVQAGVTRMEAFYTQGYSKRMGLEEFGYRSIGNFVDFLGESVPSVNDPARGAGRAGRFFRKEVELALDAVPRYNQNLVCRVWGNRSSTRLVLYNTAISVVLAKIPIFNAVLSSGSATCTEDLMGKFVEVTVNIQSGPIEALVRLGAGIFLAIPPVGPDELDGITQKAASPQPTAILDSGARSNIYVAMSQVLAGICGVTPRANNGIATLRTLPPLQTHVLRTDVPEPEEDEGLDGDATWKTTSNIQEEINESQLSTG